jgi:EAL domain
VVHFAAEVGCQLIGEGIETEAERRTLRLLGVPLGQGYLLGRPLPAPGVAVGQNDRLGRPDPVPPTSGSERSEPKTSPVQGILQESGTHARPGDTEAIRLVRR